MEFIGWYGVWLWTSVAKKLLTHAGAQERTSKQTHFYYYDYYCLIAEIVRKIHYPLNNPSSWRYNKTSTLIWSLGWSDADAVITVIRFGSDYHYRRIWNYIHIYDMYKTNGTFVVARTAGISHIYNQCWEWHQNTLTLSSYFFSSSRKLVSSMNEISYK